MAITACLATAVTFISSSSLVLYNQIIGPQIEEPAALDPCLMTEIKYPISIRDMDYVLESKTTDTQKFDYSDFEFLENCGTLTFENTRHTNLIQISEKEDHLEVTLNPTDTSKPRSVKIEIEARLKDYPTVESFVIKFTAIVHPKPAKE